MELVHSFRRLVMPLHRAMRRRKVNLFFKHLHPSPTETLLDIGGSIGMSGEFAELYEFFPRLATLNLAPEPVGCGHAEFIQGNACAMPLDDQSFDYVFSNAVIEHVGDFALQRAMASEIERVARKGFFITTPNRHFPLDPHSYLPFYHLLPLDLRRRLAPGPLRRWIGRHEDYWMLSRSHMRRLFPKARIVTTPDFTSIIAIGHK